MDKVLIEVYCPITSQSYDIYIPLAIVFGEIKIMIAGLIENMSNNKFFKDDQIVICQYDDGSPLPEDKTPQDLHILNGDKFMIF